MHSTRRHSARWKTASPEGLASERVLVIEKFLDDIVCHSQYSLCELEQMSEHKTFDTDDMTWHRKFDPNTQWLVPPGFSREGRTEPVTSIARTDNELNINPQTGTNSDWSTCSEMNFTIDIKQPDKVAPVPEVRDPPASALRKDSQSDSSRRKKSVCLVLHLNEVRVFDSPEPEHVDVPRLKFAGTETSEVMYYVPISCVYEACAYKPEQRKLTEIYPL